MMKEVLPGLQQGNIDRWQEKKYKTDDEGGVTRPPTRKYKIDDNERNTRQMMMKEAFNPASNKEIQPVFSFLALRM